MGVLKPIDADKDRVGGGANGEGAVRIDNDGQKPESVGVVDNVIKALLPVVPEEGLAPFEVEAATAFAVESVDRSDNLREIQGHRAASIQPAMPTPEVAAVGEDQPADERHGLPKQLVADHISHTVRTRISAPHRHQSVSSNCSPAHS